ncbi:MAG: malate dehydrogenase [Dehalococcoidia bacterium]|nr:malate dehydrogenase [Dehalococcoidia bacterium]
MRAKVSVIGAGMVGGSCAQRLAERGHSDVVLLDIVEGLAQGKALDILESLPVIGSDARVQGTSSYDEVAGSDIVVVTSGIARKPGMSREDLVLTNMRIISDVSENVARVAPRSIVVVVTNPLDAMVQRALSVTGFPRERVIGQSGILDTARLKTFIAMELGVSVSSVSANILGGHGNSMLALPRLSTVGGVPLSELLTQEKMDALVQRAVNGGAEIVGLLKTGSAYCAPSAAAISMVDSIILDRKDIVPCAVQLKGEYGITDVVVGVPVKLGASGVEQVLELALLDDEIAALRRSADAVRETIAMMEAQ